MRPRLRIHLALRLRLDPVVTDRLRGIHSSVERGSGRVSPQVTPKNQLPSPDADLATTGRGRGEEIEETILRLD